MTLTRRKEKPASVCRRAFDSQIDLDAQIAPAGVQPVWHARAA